MMAAESPLISVVLPVFNGERYLQAAIVSILKQAFADFELIIIDDGSTDSTPAIIHSIPDPRIRYIRQENAGIGAALRHGCSLARGRYIARMDADDIAEPERLGLQVAFLEKNPDCVLTSCAVTYIDADDKPIARSFPYVGDNILRQRLLRGNPVCHPGVMMRRVVYEKTQGYRSLEPFEDHILWLELMQSGSFHNDTCPLLRYRFLPGSLSRMLPAGRQEALFAHLKALFFAGKLDDAAVREFRQRVTEEKKGSGINHAAPDVFPTSRAQWNVYRMMIRTGIPESLAARMICRIKSSTAWNR